MTRIVFTALALFLTLGSNAFAHDFWLNTQVSPKGNAQVDIGYGHDFSTPENISPKRVHLFESPHLFSPAGEIQLKQQGPNYHYVGKADKKTSRYIAVGSYRPTFWSKGPDGWDMKNRTQMPEANYCEHVSMYAKAIPSTGTNGDNSFLGKPVGQRLEIVPLVNPATVKPGEKFPVQVLVDGKPAKTVKVTATFAGFSNVESKAFSGRTNLRGKIDIIPLKAGYWFAEAEYKEPYPDAEKCDETYLLTTMTFYINE